jgi:hypothetical protein
MPRSKFISVLILIEKKKRILPNLGKAFPLSALFHKMRD